MAKRRYGKKAGNKAAAMPNEAFDGLKSELVHISEYERSHSGDRVRKPRALRKFEKYASMGGDGSSGTS